MSKTSASPIPVPRVSDLLSTEPHQPVAMCGAEVSVQLRDFWRLAKPVMGMNMREMQEEAMIMWLDLAIERNPALGRILASHNSQRQK